MWSPLPTVPYFSVASLLSVTTDALLTIDDEDAITNSSERAPQPHKRNARNTKGSNSKMRSKSTRKPTHTRRKEEKEVLIHQLESLYTQLQSLQCQSIITQTQKNNQDTQPTMMETIQQQQIVLANLQGLLSGYVKQHIANVNPIQTFIYLTSDPAERRMTLLTLRPHKLLQATQFINQRRHSVGSSSAFVDEERFEIKNGGFCLVHFSVTRLRSATSVKSVFDALMFRIFNVEIIISEKFGNITIREDDDSNIDPAVSHHRLVSSSSCGVQVEMNMVLFSAFHESQDGHQPYGIIVSDYVDEDDLYPYRALERVRKDVTKILLVTKEAAGENGEEVVVLTRWILWKIHTPKFDLPKSVLREMLDESSQALSEQIKNIFEWCMNN